MTDVSVIVCTHNPRRVYLRRVLQALKGQSLPMDRWELLVVDNASTDPVADIYDLSWHPRARHVLENTLGLTPARLRGIAEARGELLVFVDDDNVLAPDFLEEASRIHTTYTTLGVFGAGRLEPEFEVEPPREIGLPMQLLALRTVPSLRWSNNVRDSESIPWGAGLCASRSVASAYGQFVERHAVTAVLDRRGKELFCGGDDVFSWVAASLGYGFGIFPQLRVTHLIPADRLSRHYFLRLIHDHAFSHGVLQYTMTGIRPQRMDWFRYVHLLLHGARNGQFSMRCQWARARGEDRAARFVLEERLQRVEVVRAGQG